MLIGYARVSTHEQLLDLQLDALAKAGCDPAKTYTDKISSSKAKRLTSKKPSAKSEQGIHSSSGV